MITVIRHRVCPSISVSWLVSFTFGKDLMWFGKATVMHKRTFEASNREVWNTLLIELHVVPALSVEIFRKKLKTYLFMSLTYTYIIIIIRIHGPKARRCPTLASDPWAEALLGSNACIGFHSYFFFTNGVSAPSRSTFALLP